MWGIVIRRSLDTREHVWRVYKRAKLLLCLNARTYENMSGKNILPSYKTLAGFHLEYATRSCKHCKQKDIESIESVQRRAIGKYWSIVLWEKTQPEGFVIPSDKKKRGLKWLKLESMHLRVMQYNSIRGHEFKIYQQRSRLECGKKIQSRRSWLVEYTSWEGFTMEEFPFDPPGIS